MIKSLENGVKNVVGMRGFEPPISRAPQTRTLTGLSYIPKLKLNCDEYQNEQTPNCFNFAKIKFHSLSTMKKYLFYHLPYVCFSFSIFAQEQIHA